MAKTKPGKMNAKVNMKLSGKLSVKVKVLIVDDEKSIRETLKVSFQQDDYHLEEAKTGAEALSMVKSFHPNILILDLGLPDQSGLSVLRELRTWTKVPVIILTATDDDDSKVTLLDAGADDYLTKPFSGAELMARVRAAIRRNGTVEATPIFVSGELMVDVSLRRVEVKGSEVKLTMTEFELLQRLVRDAGKIVPQSKLLKEIWGSSAQDESHYLRIYIKQLRKKLEADPTRPRHILTEPAVGYRLV